MDSIQISTVRLSTVSNCNYSNNPNSVSVYEPVKLMKAVVAKVNEVCLRYLDNSELYNLRSIPSLHNPTNAPLVSTFAIKNTRRQMEDRYIYIDDLNTIFDVQVRNYT